MKMTDERHTPTYIREYPLPDEEDKYNTSSRSVRTIIVVGIVMLIFPLVSAVNAIDVRAGRVVLGLLIMAAGLVSYTDKSKKYPDQRYGSVLAMTAGGMFLVLPLMFSALGSNMDMQMTWIGVILIFYGIMITAAPVTADKERRKRCNYRAVATVVNMCEFMDSHYNMRYSPLWEYEVCGRTVRIKGMAMGAKYVKREGETEEFLVNSDDPYEIYRPLSAGVVFCGFISLCFTTVGIKKFSDKHCKTGTASYIFTKVPRNPLKNRVWYGIIYLSSWNEGEPYG